MVGGVDLGDLAKVQLRRRGYHSVFGASLSNAISRLAPPHLEIDTSLSLPCARQFRAASLGNLYRRQSRGFTSRLEVLPSLEQAIYFPVIISSPLDSPTSRFARVIHTGFDRQDACRDLTLTGTQKF